MPATGWPVALPFCKGPWCGFGRPRQMSSTNAGRRLSVSPREHHEWCLGMWKRMDRDNSGLITKQELDCEEFRNVLKSVLVPNSHTTGGALYARAQTNQEQVLRFCMRKADLNNDGSLSFEEFKSVMRCLREETLEKHTANLIFAMFDLDGDQAISENEFREIYRFYLGHNPTFAEFSDEWARLNSNLSGCVSREMYIRWLQSSQNPVFRHHAPGVRGSISAEQADVNAAGASDEAVVATTSTPKLVTSSSSSFERQLPAKLGSPALRRSGSDFFKRPKWNQRFNNNAGADPNLVLPQGERRYFQKPQTLKELGRFYNTHTGFERQSRLLSAPDPPKKLRVVSTDTADVTLAFRHRPAGTMREFAASGEVLLWEDRWQLPLRLKSRHRPSSRPLAPHALFEASASVGPLRA